MCVLYVWLFVYNPGIVFFFSFTVSCLTAVGEKCTSVYSSESMLTVQI